MLKATALRSGDTIALIAPASTPQTAAKISNSVRYFERLGYRVELGKHVRDERGYLAGSDRDRIADIHSLVRNKHIKALFFLRGGYGTIRLLPELDYDLIAKHPKIFVGYSDATSLFSAIYRKTGLQSLFFGPMPGVDIWNGFDPFAEECMWRALTSVKPFGVLPSAPGDIRPLRKLHRGEVIGRFIGGNLTVFSSIMGTPFAPNPSGKILFFEDVGEEPYRLDRYLAQLRAAGYLDKASAILLGQFSDCEAPKGKKSLSTEQVFEDYFGALKVPVLSNLPWGHIPRQWTLALGVRLAVSGNRVEVRESVLV
ncbi:MAG: LD-carboxypeptidase [Bacteroidetes bacterium]|nr:LD-carboxypeptidase [Bacteroidota bacterium]